MASVVTLLAAAVVAPSPTAALHDCSHTPNCTERRRLPCDPAGEAASCCGDCVDGAHGANGPMNSVCLSNASCVAVFPGQDGCPSATGSGTHTPFLVPFGACSCDDGEGRLWPTARGMCAMVEVTMRKGVGLFVLRQCRGPTCEPASCTHLATWWPSEYPSFSCRKRGTDSFVLSDDCAVETVTLPGDARSSLCGHPGFIADPKETVPDGKFHAVRCELAPKCPASVLGFTRPEESCCVGHPYTYPITEWGINKEISAPGFCSRDFYGDELGCAVRTVGPGWSGCACIDRDGSPLGNRVCTIDCRPPGCQLPDNGIRPTPKEWLTSQLPNQFKLKNIERSQLDRGDSPSAARVLPLAVFASITLLPIYVALANGA